MYTEDKIGSYTPAVNRKVIKINSRFFQFISCCPPRPVQHDHITARPRTHTHTHTHTQQKSLHIHFERISSDQDQWTIQERSGGRLIRFSAVGCVSSLEETHEENKLCVENRKVSACTGIKNTT